ncbi:glutaminase [Acidovorax sp. FG27]|uniref:glutaminase n=1 Tax=Acidovorax sp. FG27 TaxID=3133652 RepID=UPI0030E99FFE
MNFQHVLDEINTELRPELGQAGKVADYIPALGRVPAERLGIALRTCDGREAASGDSTEMFSIQSLSKVFSLTLAMKALGEELWKRVGREPSGTAFNSLIQLELEEGMPRNPFINAGAIAVADRLVSLGDAPGMILEFLQSLCGEPVAIDPEVADSEAENGHRNLALAHFMKSFGKIDNPVAQVLDAYFHQCAIRMNCVQLARAAAYLCCNGLHPLHGEPVVADRQARRINALMLTCGTYDAAGEFAFRVGLPCKSGVGGGVVAILPDELTLCVWSPALDESGNSELGMRALELFVAKTGLSVF